MARPRRHSSQFFSDPDKRYAHAAMLAGLPVDVWIRRCCDEAIDGARDLETIVRVQTETIERLRKKERP